MVKNPVSFNRQTKRRPQARAPWLRVCAPAWQATVLINVNPRPRRYRVVAEMPNLNYMSVTIRAPSSPVLYLAGRGLTARG